MHVVRITTGRKTCNVIDGDAWAFNYWSARAPAASPPRKHVAFLQKL